ncbi:MAG: hypothetical protein ACI4GO_01060 [Hominenteromicrobium sp.]
MKNIKKLLAAVLAAALCLSLTACAQSTTSVSTLETSSAVSEGETAPADKDPSGYDSDIQGLCKYFEDNGLTAGEKVQMSYDVIGALNGYKYAYRYNDSNVQLELYEFPTEEIPETAQGVLDSLRADGTFTILDNTVPGYLSENGRFLMIYTDSKSEKDETSKAHKAHVLSCFEAFTQQADQ